MQVTGEGFHAAVPKYVRAAHRVWQVAQNNSRTQHSKTKRQDGRGGKDFDRLQHIDSHVVNFFLLYSLKWTVE
jgi:hypothetical protein